MYHMEQLFSSINTTDPRKEKSILLLEDGKRDEYSLTVVQNGLDINGKGNHVHGFRQYLRYWEQNPDKPLILHTQNAKYFEESIFFDNVCVIVSSYDMLQKYYQLSDKLKKEYGSNEFWNKLLQAVMQYHDFNQAVCDILNVNTFESNKLFSRWIEYTPFENKNSNQFNIERKIEISVNLHDYENGSEVNEENKIYCTRYTYPVIFSKEACKARYGEGTHVGQENGKTMILSAVIPNSDFISEVGNGALYSFLPTQLKLTVPIVCHVPFKLDASREFVDPQENNLWFQEASRFLAEMMDKIYLDYCHAVKADIVRYLPNKEKSLFAINNGKEKCLTEQNHFQRIHYLELPIFYTVDNTFKKSGEIFCFSESENIEEPEKVYKLMEYQRSLFISPIPVNGFSIRIEKNVKDNMLKKALKSVDKTADILEYLNSVNYSYSEEILSEIEPIKITQSQLQIILKCKKLVKLLQKICCDAIKDNKRFRLEVIDASEKLITDILKSEFNMSDVPVQIRDYLKYCHEKCICINTSDNFFLPCHNAVILSINNPLTSFASFCYAIDENDTFAIRIKIRDASKELNKYVEDSTISDNEYMRRLRQIRKIVKDSLGNEGYKSYLEIILKAGMNPNRFIQEILQNADDCFYAQDVTPNFSLSVKGSTIVTEYNETGFTRANIRSITAIGESTKKKIIGKTESIGEKGVGFKTIFAIASKVTIHSGKYHFSLSKEEPTIPTVIDNTDAETVSGTRMEITLKNDIKELPLLQKEKEVLELCLCLRKLKQLKIGKFRIEIKDTENSRTILAQYLTLEKSAFVNG